MFVIRSQRWSALTVVLGLFTSAARAEMITPDSIPNPPSAVSSTGNGLVYASNYVTTQYAGLGLNFGGTAITNMNGVSVWVPLGIAVSDPAPAGAIDYAWGLSGNFVSPGTSNPTTVSSLSVTVAGPGAVSIAVYGLHDQIPNITPVIGSTASGQVWTFNGSGITGFSVSPSSLPPPLADGGPWGVAGVSFTPSTPTVPEPSSLLLAGMGALGVVTRWRWRRVREGV